MQSFPLQHKKMQRLVLPYLRTGTCEVMNAAPYAMMDSFHAFNTKNTTVYQEQGQSSSPLATASTVPFMGQMVSGGLVDSYTGGAIPRFIAAYLSRALSMHTVVPAELRDLRTEFPEDPLIDLMLTATQRHRVIHQRPGRVGGMGASAGASGGAGALGSIVSDYDMQQYAMSADAAFFKACDILRVAQQKFLGDTAKARKVTPYDKFIADELAKAIEESVATSPAVGELGSFSQEALERVRDSGCRAVWFAATVAPTALELQRRLSLVRDEEAASGGMAPPPRKTLDDHRGILEAEIAGLRKVQSDHPFCLDVVVGNIGDARAFGVARNAHTEGSRSLLDPTRERVVPLSIDHRPFRQEEFYRVVQAGGKVESVAGEVIDRNPFYNVSRSFGHWPMKSNAQRSPLQQKLSALPHTATWRMLAGDVLVLANHAVFQTRQDDDSSIDEVAKVVGRQLNRGATPETIAAAVCDFAIRFGAPHTLQVMVAVATEPTGPIDDVASFDEWVEPGPLYVEACRNLPPFRDAFVRDCARCNVSVPEMVGRRFDRVRLLLPLRDALSLMPYYGRECGALQQVMDEEANFFDQDALRDADSPPGSPAAEHTGEMRESFQRLAKSLLGAKRS